MPVPIFVLEWLSVVIDASSPSLVLMIGVFEAVLETVGPLREASLVSPVSLSSAASSLLPRALGCKTVLLFLIGEGEGTLTAYRGGGGSPVRGTQGVRMCVFIN